MKLPFLGDLHVFGSIILRWISLKWGVSGWTGLISMRLGIISRGDICTSWEIQELCLVTDVRKTVQPLSK
jgi:hypothetical protein